MHASYFIAAFFNELVQASNSGFLLVVRSEVKNLGNSTIFLGLNLDISARDFLG